MSARTGLALAVLAVMVGGGASCRHRQESSEAQAAAERDTARRSTPARDTTGRDTVSRDTTGRDTSAKTAGARSPSAHRTTAPDTHDAAAPDTVAEGTIRVVGAAPRPATILESNGGRVTLTGTLASELAKLDGAMVKVRGPVGASPIPLGPGSRAITVRTYEIEEIAGGKPVVGILSDDGAELLVGSTVVINAPPELRQFIGSKVWVVGEREKSGVLRVGTFGVLSSTPSPSRQP
jgi:hypothetical protein